MKKVNVICGSFNRYFIRLGTRVNIQTHCDVNSNTVCEQRSILPIQCEEPHGTTIFSEPTPRIQGPIDIRATAPTTKLTASDTYITLRSSFIQVKFI